MATAMAAASAGAAEWQPSPGHVQTPIWPGAVPDADVSTHFDQRAYPAVDDADRVSCRPDFAVALYPGHMLEESWLQSIGIMPK